MPWLQAGNRGRLALKPLKIYIAASFKHLHGVQLLGRELRRMGCEILDWTAKAKPPPGLTSAERRIWMDTDQAGGQVFEFCKNACQTADLVIYYGESGQDAGVEIGFAVSCGIPVLGIRGPLESPGLMLHGAVTEWVDSAEDAVNLVRRILENPETDLAGRELPQSLQNRSSANKNTHDLLTQAKGQANL